MNMKAKEINNDNRSGTQFEIHRCPVSPGNETAGSDELPYSQSEQPTMEHVLSIGIGDGPVWMKIGRRGQLKEVDGHTDSAILGFQAIPHRFSAALAMRTRTPQTLLNGLPALSCSILQIRDTILPTTKSHYLYYVTERFSPYIGAPTDEILASKKMCPRCLINIDSKSTIIATCQCGLVYHRETPDTHPDLEDHQRLDCFGETGICGNCQRELTTQPSLAWDPQVL